MSTKCQILLLGKIMKLVNLTPHDVVIMDDDIVRLVVKPTDPPARVDEYLSNEDSIIYDHVVINTYDLVYYLDEDNITLPEPQTDTLYIVSALVAQAFPNRNDLVVPYDLVRKDGRILGCKALVRVRQEQ